MTVPMPACVATANALRDLERRAGITDRAAFWLPYSRYEEGLDRGIRSLRHLAATRPILISPAERSDG